ncbi:MULTISPECIES: YbaK/EbsC family protein [Sphingobacterium]|uniref:YbaK/EbsC family protein n=1 Tax=Sphingobacterium TaxID=28453 RepID=UPI00257F7E74|nr:MULTISPECIES: YbaK/EbsC family protein [Sphingobacterium]
MFISEISKEAPIKFNSEIQQATYTALHKLNIPFERIETDEVITMEQCQIVNEHLQMDMVKTLFLCNRKKTAFYLVVMLGNKPFNTKLFSDSLNISRVSFAPEDMLMHFLGVKVGAASIFGLLNPNSECVHVVFDRDVTLLPNYGCSDGTTTNYLKIGTHHIIEDYLPFLKRKVTIVEF